MVHAARRKILTMLQEGKLTVDEAEDMLDAVDTPQTPVPGVPKIELVGKSEQAKALREEMLEAAGTDLPVLVQGEEGTGKMLIARGIHQSSRRADGPLVGHDTSTSADTLDGELFGYEGGPGEPKKGLLEMADGGTLVLDYLHALLPETQHRIYSYLTNGYFTRVDGVKPVYADVRIIALTSRDINALVDEGRFRSDLYDRLSVCLIRPRNLRDTKEDIPLLADHFVKHRARRDDKNPPGISLEAMELLYQYDWPKNVRELSNIIEKAVVMCDSDEIGPEHLPALANP